MPAAHDHRWSFFNDADSLCGTRRYAWIEFVNPHSFSGNSQERQSVRE